MTEKSFREKAETLVVTGLQERFVQVLGSNDI